MERAGSALVVGTPLVRAWGPLDDFSRPGQSHLLQTLVVLVDPVPLGSDSQQRRETVRIVDRDRQPTILVHAEHEAQATVSTDAGFPARDQIAQLPLPGVQVLLIRSTGAGSAISSLAWPDEPRVQAQVERITGPESSRCRQGSRRLRPAGTGAP
jgi:hypothetical protein